MSEEKLDSEADEERPPERGEPKSAAERRSEARRAARERAAKERAEKDAMAKAEKAPAGKAKPKPNRQPSPRERPVSKARERRERERKKRHPSPPPRARRSERTGYVRAEGPGPARLFALLAGTLLSLLGVVGLFYDSSFDTGADLASDDLAGILMVNGWRNVIYIGTGLAALAFAARRPRATALALGLLYLVYAAWGFIVTERDIGDILAFLPLSDEDNVLHLAIGVLGLLAALVDGPLPKVPEPIRKRLRRKPRKPRTRRGRKGGEEKRRPSRPVAKRPTARKPAKTPESAGAGKKPPTAKSGGDRAADRE